MFNSESNSNLGGKLLETNTPTSQQNLSIDIDLSNWDYVVLELGTTQDQTHLTPVIFKVNHVDSTSLISGYKLGLTDGYSQSSFRTWYVINTGIYTIDTAAITWEKNIPVNIYGIHYK